MRANYIFNTAQAPATSDGTIFDTGPGFLVRSVSIANLSGKWLFFPLTGEFLPPFQSGISVLLGGSIRVKCVVQQPPALPNQGGDGDVLVTMYSQAIAPSSTLSSSPAVVESAAANIYTATNWEFPRPGTFSLNSLGGVGTIPAITCDAGQLARYKVNKFYINAGTASVWQIWRCNADAVGGVLRVPTNGNPAIAPFAGTVRSQSFDVVWTPPGLSGAVVGGFAIVVNYPAGIVAGDLIYASFSFTPNPGNFTGIPAGWVVDQQPTNNGAGIYIAFAHRIAVGGEAASVTFNIGVSTQQAWTSTAGLAHPVGITGAWSVGQITNPIVGAVGTVDNVNLVDNGGVPFMPIVHGHFSGNTGAQVNTTFPWGSVSATSPNVFANVSFLIGGHNGEATIFTWTASTTHSLGMITWRFTPSLSELLTSSNFALIGSTALLAANQTLGIDVAGIVGSATYVIPGNGLALVPTTAQSANPAAGLLGIEVEV